MKNFLSFFISLFLSSCLASSDLVIVKNHKSDYAIYIGEKPNPQLKKLSKTFQKYIYQISDCVLPIVARDSKKSEKAIILKQETSLHPQQINIQVKHHHVLIHSGSIQGLSNAIYEFLERNFHCKWYAPGVSNIPKSATLSVNKNLYYNYTPPIHTRTVHAKLFYQNKNFAAAHKVTTEAFPYYVPIAKVHTFEKMIPQDKFYKNYPRYFALRGNKRLPTQLCLTNEKVFEIVKDSVASFFKQYPKASILSVSTNDNTQYCQCENCKIIDEKENSHSGSLIRFVNKIAKHFPDKTISTLAYQYTRKPCKTKPAKNVLITLCSIECDRSLAITKKCKNFAEDLKGWSTLTNNIRIWDYTTQFTNFLAPFPNLHTIGPNIRFFRDSNAKWIFEQHSHNPSELFELKAYLMAKLLWNPNLETKDIIFEFTQGYYKQAGVYIRKYINLIHNELQKDKDYFLFLYGGPSQAFQSFLNPNLMQEYLNYFDKAALAVKHNKILLNRVLKAGIGIDYAFLELCRTNINTQFSLFIKEKNTKKINPKVLEKLNTFDKICKEFGITLMNEMGYTTTEYVANYRKSLQIAMQPNKAKGKKVKLLTKPKKYAKEDPQTLTDGTLGGTSFYANWLGFEGNHMEIIIDLEKILEIKEITSSFLQVTNHVVFFPKKVIYSGSIDGKNFRKLAILNNQKTLHRKSKINDTQVFKTNFNPTNVRYIKVFAENICKAPYWHHAAGLPSWIFSDEVIIN